MIEERYRELKAAEKGAVISILAYILIAVLKLTVGVWADSSALRADGLNNFTDIIASLAVLIGLRLARRPADDNHRYGHWKVETVASMVTSFIMVVVGGQVLISSIKAFLNHTTTSPDPIAAYVGVFSAALMLGVYLYNRNLAKRVNSQALLAAAKDNLSDAYTSIGTAIAILAASFNWHWLDNGAALVVGLIIIKTGLEVFSESAFSLSDGFSEEEIETYRKDILAIPGIIDVADIRGRTYGANIFLDVVVLMDGDMTVEESHDITEQIEIMLSIKYKVFDTDVHVEPYKEELDN
ncbi:cation diffusion facilitator family transporter [Vagococcus sp. PNs007]|uniref:Cation diffusion facilitator family transporter n=1 Tax=Vagococcus proximus TaxID=2991417 RepID=A0ABT5WYI9_9ENTE|nr:cation diffusion facilitator family transporter [Vagococcus proximus]MDF0478746.1 cation diffusion facilitator family transporter [Vagococcus proximus]